jgi:hypothetical protein
MATYEKTENGVRITADPVTVILGGEELVIRSSFTFLEGDGTVITERKLVKGPSGGEVTFEEYFTGGFGTTEYQADMSDLTLGADDENMNYSYLGRKVKKEKAGSVYVNIPDVHTKVVMGGDNDLAIAEEGIAFSPVYHLRLRKTISKGVVKTWLRLQKAN